MINVSRSGKLNDHSSILYFFILISFGYSLLILFPNLFAKWGLIDDHWIAVILGKNHILTVQHIPKVIKEVPEIGGIGKYPRFQPFYIIFRLCEAFLWGNNPTYWYVFRIVLFGITVFLSLVTSVEIFGVLGGGLLTFVVASHRFWGDVWARLGPAEAYAAPLFLLYCFSYWRLWKYEGTEMRFRYGGVIIAFSGVCLLGIKENFLFIVPMTTILLLYHWRKQTLSPNLCKSLLCVLLFGGFVVGAIVLGLRHCGGTDFYKTPVDISTRFKMIVKQILSIKTWRISFPGYIPFVVSLVTYLALSLFRQCPEKYLEKCHKMRAIARNLLIIESFLFVLWLFQIFVYINTPIPRGNRYDFPALLFIDLSYFLLFWQGLLIFTVCQPIKDNQHYLKLRWMIWVCIAFLLLFYRVQDITLIYNKAELNSQKTRIFIQMLSSIVDKTGQHPERPIIIESHWVWDFEAIGSLRRYLSVYGVSNQLMVKLVGYSPATVGKGFQTFLAENLAKRSKNGDFAPDDVAAPEGTHMLPYYPLDTYTPGEPCFVVSFSAKSNLNCQNLGKLPF